MSDDFPMQPLPMKRVDLVPKERYDRTLAAAKELRALVRLVEDRIGFRSDVFQHHDYIEGVHQDSCQWCATLAATAWLDDK